MSEENERRCDVDDILCRMTALSHLKGLQSALGGERFKAEFPELQSLNEKIHRHEAELRDTLGKCGLEPLEPDESIIRPRVDIEGEENAT